MAPKLGTRRATAEVASRMLRRRPLSRRYAGRKVASHAGGGEG